MQRIQLSGLGRVGPTSLVLDICRVFFCSSGRGVGGEGEGLSFFSHRLLSEAEMGEVDFAKELVKAKADVDASGKGSYEGMTALMFAVAKMENSMSEKRPRFTCKGIALSVVTLRAQYRRILLFPAPPPSSPPMWWRCIFRPLFRFCLFTSWEVVRYSREQIRAQTAET